MAVKKLSDKTFWDRVGKEARDMIKRIIFDKGKTVYGGKWLNGKYSPEYAKAKKKYGGAFANKVAPVLTPSLVGDLNKHIKPNPNGFQIGFPTKGNVVQGLRERFGKKGTITSEDRPMPEAVLKYVAREYHKHIKKNQTCTTRKHKIGRK